MSTLKLAETHNKVAFLEKPTESKGFEQIIDFLNASSIKYALTVNPTIYVSCIDHFWNTGVVKKVNEEAEIHALIDGKRIVVFEATIRSVLYAKTTAWNEFSSTVASAIICLATNQKFNFSKLILEGMLRNLDAKAVKFLMYPRLKHHLPPSTPPSPYHNNFTRNTNNNLLPSPTPNQPTTSVHPSQPQTKRVRKPTRRDIEVTPPSEPETVAVKIVLDLRRNQVLTANKIDKFGVGRSIRLERRQENKNSMNLKRNENLNEDEVTLAQTLQKLKNTTPREKGVVIREKEQGDTQRIVIFKKQKTDKLSQEELQQLMIIVLEEGMNRLYDTCGVHHISTKDGVDIFMLDEREYPLSRGVLTLLLVVKLMVDQHSEMANELL
ncbi:hypothetical protein Tco_1302559 [Tanacetum coccineum]